MSAADVEYRTRDGDMVDEIAFNYYGKTAGTMELVLAANPGLAEYEILPAGLVLILPPLPAEATATQVKLWS